MRRVTLLLALTATLAACQRTDNGTNQNASPTTTVAATTNPTRPTTSLTPPSVPTAPPTTASPTTTAPNTTNAATGLATKASTDLTNADPQQSAKAFITAALNLDAAKLRALTDPSYSERAIAEWIAPTDDFGATTNSTLTQPETAPTILATKLLSNAAGQARVAVFVDSNDLAVAALPFVVQLVERNAQWFMLDATLPTT
jgi:hypothetical protein